MKQKLNKELLLLLPDEVKAMNLPPKAQEIFCQFIAMADKNGWCYSTVEGLANALNCSKSTVLVYIKILENLNLIIERVVGKKGTATRFKINLDLLNNNTYSNNSTEYNNNCKCNPSIEDVILLKFKELDDLINKYFESKKQSVKIDDSTIKEKKIKEYKIKQINNNINKKDILIDIDKNIDINKKENIEIDMNKDIDKRTCKYKKRKKNDSKTKKFFYYLKGSSITFSSWVEAQEYAVNNNLNFDECFKKVEVFV